MQVQEGVRITSDLQDITQEVNRLRGAGVDVGFDIETTGLDPMKSKIIALQFKPRGKQALIIDVRFMEGLKDVGSILEPLFDGIVTLVGHNLKFDLEFMLAQLGLAGHKVYDTMLAEQVITGYGWSSAEKRGLGFGMPAVATKYGLAVEKESRSWFEKLDEREEEWNAPFPIQQVKYMRQDVSVVHRIKDAQSEYIREYKLQRVLDIELRALFAIVGIEVFGVQINRQGWEMVLDRVTQRLHELEEILHLGVEGQFDGLDIHILKVRNDKYMEKWHVYQDWKIARDTHIATMEKQYRDVYGKAPGWGEEKKRLLDLWYGTHGKMVSPPQNKSGVNLGSWMQVRDGFNSLGVPVKGTSEEELTPHIHKHPLVKVYLEYSGCRKLVSVYGKERGKKEQSFLEMLDEHDRLRASYQQIGADTGRMSSYNPNFQQIPADGLGAELRKNVIAAPGHTLVVADFSNIELRIVAELSGDKFLLDAFASGTDVHAYTAVVMFKLKPPSGVNLKDWTDSQDAVVGGRTLTKISYRKIAKTINYMLLYGAGVKRLAFMLEISERDAKELLRIYYETFSTSISWLKSQKDRLEIAKRNGFDFVWAETRSGRRRWFTIPPYPEFPHGKDATVEEAQAWEMAVDAYKGELASIKRQLANTPIQGLSADITKLAAALWYESVGYDPDMKLVAIIHDEFIIEARQGYEEEAAALLKMMMFTSMRTYLKVVDLGKVEPEITPYWKH